MKNQPIGVMDSGVGGLSVLREVKKLLPTENFIFVADQAYVPYGEKTKKELEERLSKVLDFLVAKNIKMMILACNTATVYTLEYLRKKYSLPIVGTVPVIKTIANATKTKKTAVFSTPATSKSPYLKNLIKKFANGVSVVKVGGWGLEQIVEEGDLENKETKKILEKILKPLVNDGVDAIALGCTHYPFLREQIEKIVGSGVFVCDSGGAIARRVKQILENNKTLCLEKTEDVYFTTGDPLKFKRVAEKLLKENLEACKINL